MTSDKSFIFHKQLLTIIIHSYLPQSVSRNWIHSTNNDDIRIYNGAETPSKFQDNWSSAHEYVMQDLPSQMCQHEGLYYSLHHPTSSIPYLRFTKIIVSHYMTIFPDISRRARDMYHNLQDDDIIKNIFNSGRHKNKVGMQIPAWMITYEMKQTEHYRMYAEVFGIDVP
ncbi:hypothetical protein Tco_0902729 [Tanacetum coccineum]